MPVTAQQAEVSLAPETTECLQRLFETELRFRRAFVPGKFSARERERCRLLVVHPAGGSFTVEAEAVYIKIDDPGAGVGLDLVGLTAEVLADLESFVRRVADAAPVVDEAQGEAGSLGILGRIRQLSLPQREKVARKGPMADRVALERIFGSSVWEGLLQNPALTVPEVAQIAKKGTLPQALVAIIVANNGWLASGEVRRALLSNPRVNGAQLDRVLRATPKPELKQIAQASPYRSQVRAAAKKLIDE